MQLAKSQTAMELHQCLFPSLKLIHKVSILVVINATALLLHMFCFVKMNPRLFIFCCLSIDEVPQPSARPTSHKVVLAFGSSLGCICLLILGFGFLLWWRHKHNKQIFFDVNGNTKAIPCIRRSESIRVSFY